MIPERILVTGGAGFVGSNFVRFLFSNPEFHGVVVNADLLTYAGNLENLADVAQAHGGTRYYFERIDIRDRQAVEQVFERYGVDTVVHFAAESHVDRSIHGPGETVSTNVNGTLILLEAARKTWSGRSGTRFHHISTDEVYGSLGARGRSTEKSPYDPRSPYSASKAAADHLVRAFSHTYGLPVTITCASNTYGPYQFPEKLIPHMITAMLEGAVLPIYGDGKNIRDWLFVDDHCRAIWLVLVQGAEGETYNIAGGNEWDNLSLVTALCEKVAAATGKAPDEYKRLISFVTDRPGHDRRYALDCSKIEGHLGWQSRTTFEVGLEKTVDWYLRNRRWIAHVTSGAYREWVAQNYSLR